MKAAAYMVRQNRDNHHDIVEIEIPFFMVREAELKKLGRTPDNNEVIVLLIDRRTLGKTAVIERDLSELSSTELRDNQSKVDKSMAKEWASWNDHGSFKPRLRSKAKNTIDARWLHKWKMIDGHKEIKSRLCMRGFQD